jgi:copper chaperone CopZ
MEVIPQNSALGMVPRQPRLKIPPVRYELIIDGMLAIHAKHALFTALTGVDGLARAEVELGKATVEFATQNPVAEQSLREAVEAAGFTLRELRPLQRTLPLL